jgi:hypothetical protein
MKPLIQLGYTIQYMSNKSILTYIILHKSLHSEAMLYFKKKGSICRILGFHGSDYEECHLLECGSHGTTSQKMAFFKVKFVYLFEC